jgi:hypothetical protein
VGQVRGYGAWWPYKSERVVLGRFGLVGYRGCSGWAARAVGRVREKQEGLASPARLVAARYN